MGRASMLFLSWTLASCSCGDRTHPIYGDGAWRADENLIISGAEATLAFEPTLIGTTAERRVAIENRGRADIILSAPGVSGVFATGPLEQVSVPGGAAHEWVVHFSPSVDLELQTATFDVTVEGAEEPRALRLHLRGAGVAVSASATGMRLPPCRLEVRPASLVFGLLQVGDETTRTVELWNRSPETCLVTSIELDAHSSAAGFELKGGRRESASLAPGDSLALEVLARGTSVPGPKAAELRFQVTDPIAPARIIPLTASSSPRCFEVAPSPLDFGLTPVGCSRTRSVTLYNVCEAPLLVEGAIAFGAGFSVDAGSPRTLGIGEFERFEVSFSPRGFGPARGELALQFTSGTRLHELQGEGIAAQQVTESFVQPGRQSVDVLFSVSSHGGGPWSWDQDDGGLNALGATFRSRLAGAVAGLSDAGVDLHAGVIAGHWDREVWELTAPDPLVPPPPWVIGQLVSPPGASSTFTTASPAAGDFVDEAIRAASRESYFALTDQDGACFEAALRALTPPVETTLNAGFRRPGTPLVLVCQSFIGDISTHFRPGQFDDPWTPWFIPLPVPYWQRLASAAGGTHLLSVSTVAHVPGPPDCPDVLRDYQGRFAEMAAISGGRQIDTCDPDVAGAIRSLQQSLQSFSRRFALTGWPEPSAPLIVRVDGTALAADHWRYDTSLNAIEMISAPDPGTQIEITYVPRCE